MSRCPDALTTVGSVPTALLSVYDKSGIVEFAGSLHQFGWSLVSSGGTARAIADADIPVTDVAELTGLPAILGHRVVTLHPKIHGGILADPTNAEHVADMEHHGIEPIDLVVVNLYPFSSDPGIELIDIGGPAMVRAAAKNHAHVGVVVDPADYEAVLDELPPRRCARRARPGVDSPATAFAHTAAYDAAIVTWFDESATRATTTTAALPSSIHLALELAQPLRYGENPHQQGARYRQVGATSWWDSMTQHGGKELSYLNVFDTEAAWRLVHRFDAPACVVVKHANPCGVAVGRRHHRGVRPGERLRPRQRVRRHRRREPHRHRRRWPQRSATCSPRSWSHPASNPTRSNSSPRRRTCG